MVHLIHSSSIHSSCARENCQALTRVTSLSSHSHPPTNSAMASCIRQHAAASALLGAHETRHPHLTQSVFKSLVGRYSRQAGAASRKQDKATPSMCGSTRIRVGGTCALGNHSTRYSVNNEWGIHWKDTKSWYSTIHRAAAYHFSGCSCC